MYLSCLPFSVRVWRNERTCRYLIVFSRCHPSDTYPEVEASPAGWLFVFKDQKAARPSLFNLGVAHLSVVVRVAVSS